MQREYLTLMKGLREAVLAGRGAHSAPATRQAVFEWVQALAVGDDKAPPTQMSPATAVLVRQIAVAAYRTTDEQFAELRRELSEDAVFEIVIASALGAGYARLMAGLGAMGYKFDAP